MPDGPIRVAGEYEIGVHLHSDVNATVRVNVVPKTDKAAVALAEEVAAEEAAAEADEAPVESEPSEPSVADAKDESENPAS